MTSVTLPPFFMNQLYRLPENVLRKMIKAGLFSEELTAYLRLYNGAALSEFPPAVRRLIAGHRVHTHRRGRDVGSHEPGFFPSLVHPSYWKRYPDLEFDDGVAHPDTVFPVLPRSKDALKSPAPATALHIHAYYMDELPSLLKAIETNTTRPDLFITTTEMNSPAVHEIFAGYAAEVTIRTYRNIGRDVVPFLTLLPELLEREYALIGHVHLKRSLDGHAKVFAQKQTRYLIESLIGDPEQGVAAIDDIVRHWTSDPEVKLYMPHHMNHIDWTRNREPAEDIRQSLVLKGFDLPPLPERPLFPVGTMFWASPDYLGIFSHIDIDWEDKCAEPIPTDGTVLHAIERLFGAIAQSRNEKIIICPPIKSQLILSAKIMGLMNNGPQA